MSKSYYPKYSKEEARKVTYLMYKAHLPLSVKRWLLGDEEFFYDAVTTIRLWYAKHKKFSLKKEFKVLTKQYRKQLPLILAKSLKEENREKT